MNVSLLPSIPIATSNDQPSNRSSRMESFPWKSGSCQKVPLVRENDVQLDVDPDPPLSAGLLIYSDHVNSKKGYFAVFIQRRLVVCHLMIGSKTISLSSRYPIELNKWHRCFIEIHGQKLTLILNQEHPVMTYELFSTNILWPRSLTFIGNLPIQYRSFDMLPNSVILDGFRGAIQKVIDDSILSFISWLLVSAD